MFSTELCGHVRSPEVIPTIHSYQQKEKEAKRKTTADDGLACGPTTTANNMTFLLALDTRVDRGPSQE
jgi:hypothetical protein